MTGTEEPSAASPDRSDADGTVPEEFEPPPRPRPVDWILGLLPLVLSLALVGFVWRAFGDLSALAGARWGWFVLALLLSATMNAYVGAYKWSATLDACHFPMDRAVVRRIWIGLLPATFFTPFQSGHVLYGIALWKASGAHAARAAEAVVYDKYLSLIGTFGLVGVGQLLLPEGTVAARPVIAAVCAAAVAAYFLDHLAVRLLGRFEVVRRHSALLRNRIAPSTKVRLLLLAMVYQSSDTAAALLACAAIGAIDAPLVVAGVVPLAMLLSYVPVTVSGFGARDALFVFLLADAMSRQQAVVIGSAVNVIEYVWPAVFGLFALRPLIRLLRAPRPAAPV